MKNYRKKLKINDIFKEWNPLGVPDSIVEDEYKDYVHYLSKNILNSQEINNYIYWVFENQLGYDKNEAGIYKVNIQIEKIEAVLRSK